jgi:hypothetical protein
MKFRRAVLKDGVLDPSFLITINNSVEKSLTHKTTMQTIGNMVFEV